MASAAGALAVSRQGAEPSLPWRKDCAALLSGASVASVMATEAEVFSSNQGSCKRSKDLAFASRLNSMKERRGESWISKTEMTVAS